MARRGGGGERGREEGGEEEVREGGGREGRGEEKRGQERREVRRQKRTGLPEYLHGTVIHGGVLFTHYSDSTTPEHYTLHSLEVGRGERDRAG